MNQAEFILMQDAFLFALGPILFWLLVLMVAVAILAAMFMIWLGMLSRITR